MPNNTKQPNQNILSHQSILHIRKPTALDGSAIHALIARCPPLDCNSMYCNLLQASHFADTSILAEIDNRVVGFISGYRLPKQPNILFVWQVAVDSRTRGQGLAKRLLKQLLSNQSDITFLHTTITASNMASWSTFKGLARDLNAELSSREIFNKEQHLGNQHASEFLLEIGPLQLPNLEQ